MDFALVALALSLAAGSAVPRECEAAPPSRVSDFYWGYLEACGCENVSAPSKASLDYKRFQKVCSQWRERNPKPVIVVVPANASPAPPDSSAAMVIKLPATPECDDPPSRTADSFWSYIEACGCTQLAPVPDVSPDHTKFLKACHDWRERNPASILVLVPSPQPPR